MPSELATRFVEFYPAAKVVGWTNPENNDASTIDYTLLELCVSDVLSEFSLAGIASPTFTTAAADANNVNVGKRGVFIKLIEASGKGNALELWDKWKEGPLKALKRVSSRDRILPTLVTPDQAYQLMPDSDFDNMIAGSSGRDPNERV